MLSIKVPYLLPQKCQSPTILLHFNPSYCSIAESESADELAKEDTEAQQPDIPGHSQINRPDRFQGLAQNCVGHML